MLNFGRYFVDVQPEKLTIKHGNTEEMALTALVVEGNHLAGFLAMLLEAQKDMNARKAVFDSVDIPLYIKVMCDAQFKELLEDIKTSVDVSAKWGIPETTIEKINELLS